MNLSTRNNINLIPGVAAIALLLLAIAPLPYGYFIFLKWVVALTLGYYIYWLYQKQRVGGWFWTFLTAIILFNPIAPIYLNSRGLWIVIDVILAVLLGVFLYQYSD